MNIWTFRRKNLSADSLFPDFLRQICSAPKLTDLPVSLKPKSYPRSLLCKAELSENQGVQYRIWYKTGLCFLLEKAILGKTTNRQHDAGDVLLCNAMQELLGKKATIKQKTDQGGPWALFQTKPKHTWENPSAALQQEGGTTEERHSPKCEHCSYKPVGLKGSQQPLNTLHRSTSLQFLSKTEDFAHSCCLRAYIQLGELLRCKNVRNQTLLKHWRNSPQYNWSSQRSLAVVCLSINKKIGWTQRSRLSQWEVQGKARCAKAVPLLDKLYQCTSSEDKEIT